MKVSGILLLVAAGLHSAASIQFDASSSASLRNASATLAYGLMSGYSNNQSDTAATLVGTLPQPLYWWEAGAVWGGMLDYWAYTNDTSYNPTITQALLAQTGTDNNYMPVAYYSSLGNDDQAFWVFAALTALEYGFPNNENVTWLELAENAFNSMVPRWGLGGCGGGLKWQIFSSNAGYDYKNSVSNGGFFQIAARLARYTGNSTYTEWAEKIFSWSQEIGLIDSTYRVYDGTDDTQNCTSIDHDQWSYEPAVYIYGAAMMYNYTNASTIWASRISGLLSAANSTFFSPYKNATDIMFEPACERTNNCDNDEFSFKAYLARWLAKTTIVAPFTANTIQPLLLASANAAAQSCSGGANASTCGQKWYVGGYDGSTGIGQQLSALEVVQALLAANAPTLRTSSNVTTYAAPSSAASGTATGTANPSTPAKSAGAAQSSKSANQSVDKAAAAAAAVIAGLAALSVAV